MIGFYDYTVVLTFLSVLTSIFGMTQAMDGHFRIAIVCLALSGRENGLTAVREIKAMRSF